MNEALILQRESPLPLAEAGKILARHLGLHAADATARARYCGGILVEEAPASTLQPLAAALEEIGVLTRIVPSGPLRLLPHGYRAIGLEFLEDALLARMVDGSSLVLLRDEITAIHFYAMQPLSPPAEDGSPAEAARPGSRRGKRRGAIAAIRRQGFDGAFGTAMSPRGRALSANLKAAGLASVELHLTLCCQDPIGPVRITKDLFDFSCLEHQKQAHSLDNFLMILDDVAAYLSAAWNRDPLVRFLRELDPALILRAKGEEVTRFERWIYQWMRLERREATAAGGDSEDAGL